MSVIHFLNVKKGDCTLINHDGGHNTMIDVCNAKPCVANKKSEIKFENEYYGNHNRKDYPVNPVEYLNSFGIKNIFRFILTHPDMDHMDGIRHIFEEFNVTNFWDVKHNKIMNMDSDWNGYDKEDWEYYQSLRDGRKKKTILNLYAGSRGEYYNRDDRNGNGDELYILSPTEELVSEANKRREYNDCSYVILYKAGNRKIIFAGDSGNKTWDFIIKNYEKEVKDVDLLIAPHHGRDTGGNDEYLDVLRPKLTLFGNAESEHLDYSSWNNRNLKKITNNEADCIIAEIINDEMNIYCTYGKFAKKYNINTYRNEKLKAWFLMKL